jgi:hypothetical protein
VLYKYTRYFYLEENDVHQNFITGSSGEIKRKNTPVKSHKTTPEFSLLLLGFCYKTTDINEMTAKRSNKDAMMQLTTRTR